jgi:phosphoribosylformylglycinamidine synthase
MGEIVRCIDGIGEACRALAFPVVSGNCSLYNETNGEPILPTPAIGGVGLIENAERTATIALKKPGDVLVLVGATEGHLGQSLFLREIENREEGAAPPVDLAAEKRNGDFVRDLIRRGRTQTVHDVSDGGLLIAVAEMAMAGRMGAELDLGDRATIPFLFGEDQARFVIAVTHDAIESVLADAMASGIPAAAIGNCGSDALVIPGTMSLSVDRMRQAHESWLPSYMSGEL